MKLENTHICLDCDEIFDGSALTACNPACPSCGSRNSANISRWLGGPVRPVRRLITPKDLYLRGSTIVPVGVIQEGM